MLFGPFAVKKFKNWPLILFWLICKPWSNGHKNLPRKALFTQTRFQAFAKQMTFFPGVLSLFQNIKTFTQKEDPNVQIFFFVVSSGIESIIEACSIAKEWNGLFSSAFHYSSLKGELLYPKRAVSFTDKTRFLFVISKGISFQDYFRDPTLVNAKIHSRHYEIPFSNMIYVGDGFSDVPCFSLLKSYGGRGIAVFKEKKEAEAHQLLRDARVLHVSRADGSASERIQTPIQFSIQEIIKRQ